MNVWPLHYFTQYYSPRRCRKVFAAESPYCAERNYQSIRSYHPMSDRDALHASICANPDDDTPRLVFADWLDENGESKRAAFIRASIEEFRQATADTSASAVHEFFLSNLIRASVSLDWSEVYAELHKLNTAFRTTGNVHFQPTVRSEKLPRIKGMKYDFISRGFFNHIHITNPVH